MVTLADIEDNEYKVLGIVDVWPGKKNGYNIDVYKADPKNKKMFEGKPRYEMRGVPIAEWDLILMIQSLVANKTLLRSVAKDLLNKIDEYGQEKYEAGSESEAMTNAGPDI